MIFETLGLSKPILRAVQEQGYSTPTPIQIKAVPIILNGKDLMASAQTGTGKTAGFVLPILERLMSAPGTKSNRARVLVLTPTRELAAQVHDSVKKYSKYVEIHSTVVFGGVNINPQMRALRRGVDVLVATPGRLLDLFRQNAVKFSDIETLVLDEADRMLDMGFIHDIKTIQSLMPQSKQTLLFSATFSDEIRKLAAGMLENPTQVDVSPKNTTAKNVQQKIHPVDKKRKPKLLSHLIRDEKWSQVLVFSKTKHGANRLVKQLYDDGILATAIHGNKSQAQRTKALSEFKNGKVDILVATDIAARGLDIVQLPQVVNFDLPHVPEDYVHRIGRTGRAGREGHAISLVSADEIKQLQDIERVIKKNIERQEIEGFEPLHAVPDSRPVTASHKPNRDAKTKSNFWKNKSKDSNKRRRNSKPRRRKRSGDTSLVA
ncbi:MAG: DEAD/DEAH box helicase [Pseudomonadales bacterium]|jgi:ATP-dependent RNA helicase RhlE|nr:ATP-dependent RNA helicase [Gammaproteobacteria bacterium]MDP6026245.1 DEAD/DEAH box helicase [Pseudomonadales bacterium]MDP7451308.1 DEAD/DEAH box helicase [Arenicellales bacterium]MDP6317221.1 DEAD/DEAH box helicase [Pseudomonadales bacterium]MDP7314120.1 DEAD/DEAH box helicase [Pseudomonadales bacterium]|tara:strand:+ start:7841 stop:9139 length:1299 start_codon:yes stop_codon:yes gene_type:complete